ncbi:Hypothetical protein Minf_1339 [Methylacidiphilum infernorum V4]|uniref:Uncharacterized protein n=1 Tax=Methylacidiphilum infernorum (isolate V4) TaxID=481448 RepID=B3DVP0_METI4|nr:Hypothetical protein Minf_1339 [Methylacidiphilum infernorum V4]
MPYPRPFKCLPGQEDLKAGRKVINGKSPNEDKKKNKEKDKDGKFHEDQGCCPVFILT